MSDTTRARDADIRIDDLPVRELDPGIASELRGGRMALGDTPLPPCPPGSTWEDEVTYTGNATDEDKVCVPPA